jgi:hypothetical protein
VPPVARSHHYVPEFYLAGFTRAGTRDDFLFVRDRIEEKGWRQRPRELACERDYYRVEVEGVAPDAVEKALGEFETQAADAIRRIREARELVAGEDFDTLLNFVAIQAARVPQFREMFERNKIHFTKFHLRMVLGHPEAFAHFAEERRREGRELPPDMTREKLIEFLEDESRYTVEIPREASIKNMVEMAEHLLPVLAARRWMLMVSEDEEADFICSDRPVILIPTRADGPRFLGFGQTHTEVLMPLDRRTALVGHFGDGTGTKGVDRICVGLFNQRMVDYSERFIYSSNEAFLVSVPRDGIGGGSDQRPAAHAPAEDTKELGRDDP